MLLFFSTPSYIYNYVQSYIVQKYMQCTNTLTHVYTDIRRLWIIEPDAMPQQHHGNSAHTHLNTHSTMNIRINSYNYYLLTSWHMKNAHKHRYNFDWLFYFWLNKSDQMLRLFNSSHIIIALKAREIDHIHVASIVTVPTNATVIFRCLNYVLFFPFYVVTHKCRIKCALNQPLSIWMRTDFMKF